MITIKIFTRHFISINYYQFNRVLTSRGEDRCPSVFMSSFRKSYVKGFIKTFLILVKMFVVKKPKCHIYLLPLEGPNRLSVIILLLS